ncbi:hypothetical protein LRR81_00395 [Metabacillus sp. GX 13764]|uniref:hypothetical protein n=1 Tax=Metabacillus kandeliae TaxID=2900151 RepID=UPI001E4A8C3F|nr:hypothetical protein [Metabacillus kandeliae]MCD7032667.1 hypothetical protein [Metabacillus kandeliae]
MDMRTYVVQYTDKDTLERVFTGPVFPTEEQAYEKQTELEEKGHLDVVFTSENDILEDRE